MPERAQLPLSVLEVAVAVALLLALSLGFALGSPPEQGDSWQLDRYAEDAMTVALDEGPAHRNATRLAEVTASPAAFARERAALARRIDRILPGNLFYEVTTPHGSVGASRPSDVRVGTSSAATPGGRVTIRVWYA
jgi:hypothetical protein